MCAIALVAIARDSEADGVPRLSVRIAPPPAIAFDSTALGHATHRVRITFGNPNSSAIALGPHQFRFTPTKDGLTYDCGDGSEDTRWPMSLEPGASITIERVVHCNTPLVGRYDVEVRARRTEPNAVENVLGSFVLTIDGGSNAPVRSPLDGRLWIAASATREIRPGQQSQSSMPRVHFAFVNATRGDVALAPSRFVLHVMRRESSAPPCPERIVDVPGTPAIAGAKTFSFAAPLVCDFTREGVYDVDVSLLTPNGRVKIGVVAIRAAVLPTPHTLPQSKSPIDRQGPF